MRAKDTLALPLIALMVLGVAACQPEEPAEVPGAEEWAYVETTEPTLNEKRAEIEALQAQRDALEDAEAAEPVEGEEAPPTAEELDEQIESLQEEIDELQQEYYQTLVTYLQSQDIVEGAELTPEQRQAFDYKAREDMILAREYIDRGGDYSRAIDIYDSSLMADPTNEELLAAKAEAERLRYMDEERFGQIEKDMTQDEVRAALGIPKRSNIQDFEAQNRKGWFYPKEAGGAAGIYFKPKKQGDGEIWIVETADFDAVKAPSDESEDAEG